MDDWFERFERQPMYYDIDGTPIEADPNDPNDYRGCLSWARISDKHRRDGSYRIGDDEIGGYWVSTIWIGLDMNVMRTTPLIFETMVFGPPGDVASYGCRYATREQAQTGHDEMCKRVRAQVGKAKNGG